MVCPELHFKTATAAAMLDEMSVAEVTLNELSRRFGLAKSNVLRYFESREAVLLELLNEFLDEWLAELTTMLADGIDADASLETRANRFADILSRSLADRVVLCNLFGAQGGVLEHNVSVEVVKRHKRSSIGKLADMTEVVQQHLPELGDGTQMFCLTTLVTAGALSSYVPPPPSLIAAYAEEPDLHVMHSDLQDALRIDCLSSPLGMVPRA